MSTVPIITWKGQLPELDGFHTNVKAAAADKPAGSSRRRRTKASADTLSDLSPEEMDEFVSPAPSSPAPTVRRWPPVPDEIKLSVEEVWQILEDMPGGLSPEKAQEERIRRLGEALLVKREMTLVDSFVRTALGPGPTTEQREAIQAALGHMYRLGGMMLLTHTAVPMYAPVVKAAAAADARKSRWPDKKRRADIIDAYLLAEPSEPPKRLLPKVNAKLKECGLGEASLSYLYEQKKILGQSDEES
jgi:hypothetical protein